MDVAGLEYAERVEGELDAMIRRRDDKRRETEGERVERELWAESVERHNALRREQHRAAWCEHYQRMRSLHGALADEYDEKLRRLEETA